MRHLPSLHHGDQLQLPQQQDIEYVLVDGAGETPEQSFRDYLNIVRKRKWLVVLPACIILPIVLMSLIVQQPQYQATTTLLIGKANPNVLSIQEVLTPESSPGFFQTQFEIIKGRKIAEQVVDGLQLYKKETAEDPRLIRVIKEVQAFPKEVMSKVLGRINALLTPTVSKPEISAAPDQQDAAVQRRMQAVEKLQDGLSVIPREGTQVVDLRLRGDDRRDVVQQVNRVAEIYVRQNLENRLDASRKAIVWLKKEAGTLKEKIHNAELALQDYREQKSILDPHTYGSGTFQQLMFREIEGVQTRYDETRSARESLDDQIRDLETLYNQDIKEILEQGTYPTNAVIGALTQRYVQLEVEQETLLNSFKAAHPKVVNIKKQLKDIEGLISNKIKKELTSKIFQLKKERQLLLDRENSFRTELNAKKVEIVGVGQKLSRYNELKGELEINKDLYMTISKRLAETNLTEALESNNIKVLERALGGQLVPGGRLKKLVLSLMVALGLGVGLALLVEQFSKKFKSVDEVERYLGVPFLGVIPHYSSRYHGPIVLYEPGSLAAEAYRSIRTWLETSAPARLKPLLVTSAMPGEGKSTTSVNLAISFAQLGRLVIVVDVDLRRPTLHRNFGISNAGGLVDVLAQGKAWSSVSKDTALENLKVLTSGGTPVNPTELLSTNRMKNLIADLQDAFDIVIFDASVALGVPDVTILSRNTAGVVLIHNPHESDKEATFVAKKVLDRAGASVVGVLFNNIRAKDHYHYHYSYRYYESAYRSQEELRLLDAPQIDMRPTEHRHRWETD